MNQNVFNITHILKNVPISAKPNQCIPKMKSEGKPHDQSVAICLDKERNSKVIKKAKLLTAQFEFQNSLKKKQKYLR